MKIAKKVALMGMMLALVSVLTYIEHAIPPIPFLPPNVKLGLSNVVTMFCLYFIGYKEAFLLAFLKSMFVFLTRGMMAGVLSFSGGVLAIGVLILLNFLFKNKVSYVIASIFSAIAHNIGQFVAVSVMMQTNIFVYYLPVLLAFGVLVGAVTGVVLKIVMPALKKLV